MELLILWWPLLLLTLVPTVFTVSLTSSVSLALPIAIAPSALLLTPPAASVNTLSGWREALMLLARLHIPGEVSLDVGSCQHLLALLLAIVIIAWPWTRSVLAELVCGWFPIAPMERARLITVVNP